MANQNEAFDLNNDNRIIIFFYPVVALIAILVPMYTVGVIINDYIFELRYNIFDWHGHQMIFSYFYTFAFTFLLSQHQAKSKTLTTSSIAVLILLWIIDQSMIFTNLPYIYLVVSSIGLSLYIMINLFKVTKKGTGHLYILFLFGIYSVIRPLFIYALENNLHGLKEGIYETSIWILTLGFLKVLFHFIHKDSISTQGKKTLSFLATTTFSIYLISALVLPKNVQVTLLILSSVFYVAQIFYGLDFSKKKSNIVSISIISYLLICLSLAVKALSIYQPALTLNRATLHLVLSGALSLVMLLIMIRTTLLGAKQKILINKSIIAIILCLLLGATIRFIVPVINPSYFHKSLHHSMGIWTMAYLIFLFKYLAVLIRIKYKKANKY